jgi:hypothetical protein
VRVLEGTWDEQMDRETVALLGALLFLLLALVGGGFTIREIIMPSIPGWARVACLFVGAALLVPFVLDLRSAPSDSTGVDAPVGSGASAPSGEVVIREDAGSWESPQGIQVAGLLATGEQKTPSVGDQVTIQFSLQNVGSRPVTFQQTFVAVRDPANAWMDDGHENEGRVVDPGSVVEVSHSFVVSAPGTWSFWPCYTLESGEECPDEWRKLLVL